MGRKVVLDTNAWIEMIVRKEDSIVLKELKRLEPFEIIVNQFIIGEISHFFISKVKDSEYTKIINIVKNRTTFDEISCEDSFKIAFLLRKTKNLGLGFRDTSIIYTVMRNNAVLITFDKSFERFPLIDVLVLK